MKKIPYGISNYERLIENDYYYVDKAMYFKDIIDNKSRVILVTRPKRLRKILNMGMLKYSCPVIYVTLKDVIGTNFVKMLICLKTKLAELYKEYVELLKSKKLLEVEKEMFNRVLNVKADELEILNALKLLIRLLYEEYNNSVILLIDEYDAPLQNAYVEGYYDEAKKFFTELYRRTLKDNPYLDRVIISGTSKVIKRDIYSGANCFELYEITDTSNIKNTEKDHNFAPWLVLNYYQ